MKNEYLTTHNTRFRFKESLGGMLGEIPYIEIRDCEDIPSLNKANLIYIDIWNRDERVRSRIVIIWVVSGTEVTLKLHCYADDHRLKKQYREDNLLAEKIIGILCLPDQNLKQASEYRRIENRTTISKWEIAEPFQSFVGQVELWKVFFQQPDIGQLRGHHYVHVNTEGYYLAYISAGSLRFGQCPSIEVGEANFDKSYSEATGLYFDPKTRPPVLVNNGIYWELPEFKILVILPHDASNERVAEYYNYSEAFQKYEQSKREYLERMDVVCKANQVEDEVQKQRQVIAIRQALLPS